MSNRLATRFTLGALCLACIFVAAFAFQRFWGDSKGMPASQEGLKNGLNSPKEVFFNPKEQGLYYFKKVYSGGELPLFSEYKNQLPKPIFDRNPDYIRFYYKAWQLGFERYRRPEPGSPFVSNYIDEAFNGNMFLWGSSVSTMWGNYAHQIFPGIQSLDNFYATQLRNGEIVREISEKTGKLGVEGWSEPGTAGNLNHPMLAWAELESYRITANKTRLSEVYMPLLKYRESFISIYHEPSGLYLTDKSAMDDSPRNEELLCGIDVASEVVAFDHWLAQIATIIGKPNEAKKLSARAESYATYINHKLWDEDTGFYYDWAKSDERMTMRTVAAFWTMLGKIPGEQQLASLIAHLNDTASFKTLHRVPTHPVNEKGFGGNYWDGGVWSPINAMVVRGLELNGKNSLAYDIAMNHLYATAEVFKDTGMIWENYHPLVLRKGVKARPDYVGWSGIAPIKYLIEYAIGIRINAPQNEISWHVNEMGRHGIEQLRFGASDGLWNQVSLIASERTSSDDTLKLSVQCEHPFTLNVLYKSRKHTYEILCDATQVIDI